jgi:uncharacterized membrane protein
MNLPLLVIGLGLILVGLILLVLRPGARTRGSGLAVILLGPIPIVIGGRSAPITLITILLVLTLLLLMGVLLQG